MTWNIPDDNLRRENKRNLHRKIKYHNKFHFGLFFRRGDHLGPFSLSFLSSSSYLLIPPIMISHEQYEYKYQGAVKYNKEQISNKL